LIAKRYQALRSKTDNVSEYVKGEYEKLLTKRGDYKPDTGQMVEEKVKLLSDLRYAGLKADQYADFLFFGFRGTHKDDITVDVIAAQAAPVPDNANPSAFLDLFASMARVAEKHYRANDDVAKFTRDLSLRWALQLDIRKARDLFAYIRSFIAGVTNPLKTNN
jgi:hypothetical protein